MSDTYDDNQAELADVIGKVAGASMVTHYVVVVAVIDSDGDETTHLITSPGLPLWQAHGLLSFEAAGTIPQPVWANDEQEQP